MDNNNYKNMDIWSVLVRKPEGKRHFHRSDNEWKAIGWRGMD